MVKTKIAVRLWIGLAFVASPPALLAEAEAPAERLSSYMLARAEAGFSGAVLVARGSEVFLRAGFGFADVEHGVRNTPDHEPILDRHLPAGADTSWFDLVVGSYLGTDGETRTILRQGDDLKLQLGSTSFPLVPLGFRMFTLESNRGRILEFEGLSQDPATGFAVKSCGNVLFKASAVEHSEAAAADR